MTGRSIVYGGFVAALSGLAMTIGTAGASLAQAMGGSMSILPLTRIGANGEGYLADPQPITLATPLGEPRQFLSGTTKAIVDGYYPVKPGAFGWHPVKIDVDQIRPHIADAGASFVTIQNINVFQDRNGAWEAAIGVDVHSPSHPKAWTVTCHARPAEPNTGSTPPTEWVVDMPITGSFASPEEGNYDGKYYRDGEQLYLLYVRNTAPGPQLRNEIVIQPMASPYKSAGMSRVLLSTGDRFGPLNSETYANTQAKLVEAPWLFKINGKYALIYSTGAYLTPGYKAAVAWSDTLIPNSANDRYRKVLLPDPSGIWDPARKPEVLYLLQSEKPRWPNFTGSEVVGPGVASLVRGPANGLWLYFNGFRPDDMPRKPNGQIDGSHRRPYALLVHAAVPETATVTSASDAELASWITH